MHVGAAALKSLKAAVMEEPPGPSRTAEDTEQRASLCDSPPTKRRASRWQQLKAGWAGGSNISTDADQDRSSPSNSPDKQLLQSLVLKNSTWGLNERDCQTTGLAAPDTSAADLFKRCAGLQDSFLHSSHATDCTGPATASDARQVRIGPDGSLQWGAESSEGAESSAADTLLKLLQTDSCSVLDTLSSQNQGSQVLPKQRSDGAPEPLQQSQQQLDLTGVFDCLHQQQQARQRQQRQATLPKRASRPPPSSSSVAGNKQPSKPSSSNTREAQAGGRAGSQGGRTAAAKLPTRTPATAQQGSQHAAATAAAAGRPTAGATAGAVSVKANQAQAVGMPAPRGLQQSSRVSSGQGQRTTPTSRIKVAPTARPTGGSNATTRSMPGSSVAAGTVAIRPTQQPAAAAAPSTGQIVLQQEVSTISTTSSSASSMRELQAELQLELGAVLLFRLLRRWRLAAADTALDKARARPMCNLLSKRKAMRAWRLAMAAPSPEPAKRPARPAPKQHQQPQPSQQQQQQQLRQQPSQGGLRRMQVASQFHRMYRQHCCLLHWHAWAVTAAEARRVEQEQQALQEKQRALARQQEELLAEFQRRQQQELEQQREQTKLEVAVRFHMLYILHSALRMWHKNASITAALRKLHPRLPLLQPAAAAEYLEAEEGISCPTVRTEGRTAAAAAAAAGMGAPAAGGRGQRCDGGAALGLLDPAIVQQKAQLLLQHLSDRVAGGKGEQKQQQSEKPQQLALQQSQQKPKQQGIITPTVVTAGAGHKVPRPQQQQQQQTQQHRRRPIEADLFKQQPQQASTAVNTGSAMQAVSTGTPHCQHANVQPQAIAETAAPLGVAAAAADATAADVGGAELGTVQQHPQATGVLDGPSSCSAAEPGACTSSTPGRQQQEQQQQHGPQQGPEQKAASATDQAQAVSPPADADADASVCKLPAQQAGQPGTSHVVDDVSVARAAAAAAATDDDVGQQQEQMQAATQARRNKPCHSSPRRALSKQQQQQQQQQRRQSQTAGTQPDTDSPLKSEAEGKQQQQQEEEEDWPAKRARLQQQLRQLQAEEQRRHRQYQQVEQQLQALLTQQSAELAAVHAARVLVRRAGLGPWLGLMKLRGHQWQLAGRLYQWHLLTAGMGVLKHALVCRYKRHVCQHIQAWGKLRVVRHQQQQRAALSALATWATTGQHYRRQLLLRCVCGWRCAAAEGAEVLCAAAEAMRGVRQSQVAKAWWQVVQDQAHDQLMVELELSSLANSWRTTRLQRYALHCWRANAAESVQQRLREAAHQQTWSRVRGWLSELDGEQQGPSRGVGAVGVGTAVSAEGLGGAGDGAVGGSSVGVGVGAVEIDVNGWGLDVDSEGFEGLAAAGSTDVGGQVNHEQFVDCGVEGVLGGTDWGQVSRDGDDDVDLDALAEWFDAAEQGIDTETQRAKQSTGLCPTCN